MKIIKKLNLFTTTLLTSILISSMLPTTYVIANTNKVSYQTLNYIWSTPAISEHSNAKEYDEYQLYINGVYVDLKSNMAMYQDRVYLPMRELGTYIGASVGWDYDNKTAIISKNNIRIEAPVGYNKCLVITDKYTDMMSIDVSNSVVSTILLNNTTYLPLRYISESLGYTITYFSDVREVHLNNNGITPINSNSSNIVESTEATSDIITK